MTCDEAAPLICAKHTHNQLQLHSDTKMNNIVLIISAYTCCQSAAFLIMEYSLDIMKLSYYKKIVSLIWFLFQYLFHTLPAALSYI